MRRLMLLSALTLAACNNGAPFYSQLAAAEEAQAETADLTVAFAEGHAIEDGKILFHLEFGNAGLSMAEKVDVRTKVFLIPKADYARRLTAQGIVLETLITPLELASGERVIVPVSLSLPNVPAGEYFLGATTNSRVSILEIDQDLASDPSAHGIVVESRDAQLNNATPRLLDLGHVANQVDDPGVRGKYDLYHEVQAAKFTMSGGTAAHTSRNILRIMEGEDEIPPYDAWSDTISARFLFINLRDGTMSIGAYTGYEVDKVWYSIAWTPESDRAGRPIHVDYYHNAPSVMHLDPGEYVLGVLMNVNDRFELDSYPENNLDLTYLNLEPSNVINARKEVFLNVSAGTTRTQLIASIHDRSDLHEWSYSIADRPDWLEVVESNNRFFYTIEFVPDVIRMPIGVHVFDVTIRARNSEQDLSFTSKLYVTKNDGPIAIIDRLANGMFLTPGMPGAEIVDRGDYKVFRFTWNVSNLGTSDLVYAFEGSPALQLIQPDDRRIVPGESQTVSFEFPLVNVTIPRDSDGTAMQYLYVSMSSNGGDRGFGFTLLIPGELISD